MSNVSEMKQTPYTQIGGDAVVKKIVERFYELMDLLPEVRTLRLMHPEDLSESKEKLYLFLSGWLGGPQLYVERFGRPFLRARHQPFPIGNAERNQWMRCMRQTLDELVCDAGVREKLLSSFDALADHMRNRVEAA